MMTFGDLLWEHLSRKRGLSQNKLAWDTDIDPSVISKMCNGKRLNGRYSRERVLKIINWLYEKDVLEFVEEANTLLKGAGMTPLSNKDDIDASIFDKLEQKQNYEHVKSTPDTQENITKSFFLVMIIIYILGQFALILRREKIIVVECSRNLG